MATDQSTVGQDQSWQDYKPAPQGDSGWQDYKPAAAPAPAAPKAPVEAETKGPVSRFLSSAKESAIGTLTAPFVHPINTLEGIGDIATLGLTKGSPIGESVRAWANPKTRPTWEGVKSVLPEALGQGIGSVAGGAAMPLAAKAVAGAARGIGGIPGAISEIAKEAPDVAAQKAVGIGAKSPKAIPFQKNLATARPYLQGATSLEDLQGKIPAAKTEIWKPYNDAVQMVGNKVVQGPDGPISVADLEKLRLETSAQLQDARKLSPTNLQDKLQKNTAVKELKDRYDQITGALDPQLASTGINPQLIRNVHGSIKGIERLVENRNTLTESKPYGLGRIGNKIDIVHPIRSLGEFGGGIRDIAAGRPTFRGSPTDVAVSEGFRTGGPKPNLGTPQAPAVGAASATPPAPFVVPRTGQFNLNLGQPAAGIGSIEGANPAPVAPAGPVAANVAPVPPAAIPVAPPAPRGVVSPNAQATVPLQPLQEPTQARPTLVREVPRGTHEGVEENAPAKGRGETESKRPELREGVPEKGQVAEGKLPPLRKPGTESPSGLSATAEGRAAVPKTPSRGAQGRVEPVLPGMAEHVAKQKAGAAEVAGEKLTAEANTPKNAEEAAGHLETNGPLFRGKGPQKEIFEPAPVSKPLAEEYTPEEIEEANLLLKQELGVARNFEKTGPRTEMNEMGDYNPQKIQSSERGVFAGGRVRWIGSGRNLLPFMKTYPEYTATKIAEALEKPNAPASQKMLERAAKMVRAEKLAKAGRLREPGEEGPAGPPGPIEGVPF